MAIIFYDGKAQKMVAISHHILAFQVRREKVDKIPLYKGKVQKLLLRFNPACLYVPLKSTKCLLTAAYFHTYYKNNF